MSLLKKRFFRLYYRRNASKTIASLVMEVGTTVTKAGATFDTEGAADQLFVGMTTLIEGFTYRVASITSDTEFELSEAHDAIETVSGVFTTPVLDDMLGSELITEIDDYWTEFSKVEMSSFLKIEKGDSIALSTGDVEVISENASIEFNVLGFQENSSSPNVEGRWDELKTAIDGNDVDFLFFNDDVNDPYAVAYYNIVGDIHINIQAGDLTRIMIAPTESENVFDENDLDILLFTVETPVAVPGGMAGPQDVVVTCVTRNASMYYTTNGDVPDDGDTLIEEGGTILGLDDETLKVRAFKNGMTQSAVLEEIYT